MQGALLGPCFSDDELEAFLQSKGLRFQRYPDDRSLCERVADLLEQQAVIGWFQGRMEYGPRALGNRSIVADPRSQQHRDTLNLKIKFRESFRPFAPSVLAERAHEWFDVPIGYEDPYMLFVVNVRGDVTPLPAVTHIDGTARVQTVDGRHGRYRLLLEAFAERTGCPVLVNTSFNVRGEPIVCTPADAYGCFLRTNLDVLVLGRCVVVRDEQVDVPRHTVAPTGQFPLD
jgi:carbamoyltransferase